MTAIAHFATEESDPYCLTPLAAAALLHDAPWRRFGVIGDSLSAGTGESRSGYASLGWGDRVADVLRRVRTDLSFLNLAENGATTEQVLARQADRMLTFGPELLHVPSGANDIVRRTPDFDEIAATLGRMYRIAASTNARLLTFTLGKAYVVPVFADFADRVRRVNDITRSLAAEYDAVLVDMYDHPLNERANLLSADGIHFSTAGQAVLAAEVVKQLAYRLGSGIAA